MHKSGLTVMGWFSNQAQKKVQKIATDKGTLYTVGGEGIHCAASVPWPPLWQQWSAWEGGGGTG